MKAIVTGANGTVGQALKTRLEEHGWEVVPWDRKAVSIQEYWSMETFIRSVAPDAFFHLAIASKQEGLHNESWLVNWQWPSELAWITRQLQIPFVYTSTVLVFREDQQGPFLPETSPGATEGYGAEKRWAEERVRFQNPQAHVARLGWQIGREAGSNNMIDFLEKQQRERGRISASRRWLPACSFLEDTADALERLVAADPGVYHIDSNRGWTFHEIVTALNALRGNPWKVEPTDDFVWDQRLLELNLVMAPLTDRLPGLPARR